MNFSDMEFKSSVWLAIFLIVSSVTSSLANDDEKKKEVRNLRRNSHPYWSPVDDINLMKIWNKHYKGGGYKNYIDTLMREWELSPSIFKQRTRRSLIQRTNILLKRGFILPAAQNNGVEVKLDKDTKTKRDELWISHEEHSINPDGGGDTSSSICGHHCIHQIYEQRSMDKPWTDDEKINLMKIWNKTYKGKGSVNYTRDLLDHWKATSSGRKRRTVHSMLEKMRRLLKEGFTIPAEHNNGVSIKLDTLVKQKRDEERKEQLKKSQRSRRKRAKRSFHALHRNYNEQMHREANVSTIIDTSVGEERYRLLGQRVKPTFQDVVPLYDHQANNQNFIYSHQNSLDFNRALNSNSAAYNYKWIVGKARYRHDFPQHYFRTNDFTQQHLDTVSDFFYHQPIYCPQFESLYHEANRSMQLQNSYPLQHVADSTVHRPELSHYDHEAISSHFQNRSPQLNNETNISASSRDSILDHIRNHPIYSPLHNYHTDFDETELIRSGAKTMPKTFAGYDLS